MSSSATVVSQRIFNYRGVVVEEYIYDMHESEGLYNLVWIRSSILLYYIGLIPNPCIHMLFSPGDKSYEEETREHVRSRFSDYWSLNS